MTPEERAWHFLNENKKQYKSEKRTSDEIAVSMFIAGFQIGGDTLKEAVREAILVPWDAVERRWKQ